jgi:multidrug resistance efflux pump
MQFNHQPRLVLYRVAIGLFFLLGAIAVLAGCSQAQAANTPVQAIPTAAVITAAQPTAVPVNSNDSRVGTRVTGNFLSANQAALAFQAPGRIKEYKVKEGDRVKQGDVLVALDTTIAEFQVAQAEAALALAKARLQQTQTPLTKEQQDAAQAALAAAEANFDRVRKGPLPDEVAAAKANLDRAKAVLDQAQAAYDKAGGASNPYSALLPTSVNLQQATAGYQAALAQYNLAVNHPTLTELAGAASQLAQAKAAVSQLTPTAENLAIAQAGVDQAQAAVDLAKASLANSTIVAPFDGTVVLIGPKVGEYVNPGVPVVTLADLTKMQVQANVDELTLSGLKIGQPATLTVDALNGKTLPAKLSKIGLFATTVGGVTSVPVTLDVEASDAGVYPGLSATVEFQAAP